jgi:hypothetical protein
MAVSYIGRSDLPRGIRNNNPGNLETGEGWKGESGADGRFAVFTDLSWGLRALAKDLLNVYNNDGLTTIDAIVAHYAPASDGNDVAAYAGDVATIMSVPSNWPLQMPDELPGLMRGIIMHENGSPGNIITDDQIAEGITLAGSTVLSVGKEAVANPSVSLGIAVLVGLGLWAAFGSNRKSK